MGADPFSLRKADAKPHQSFSFKCHQTKVVLKVGKKVHRKFGGRVDRGIAPSAPHRNSGRAAFPHPALYETNCSFITHRYSHIVWVQLFCGKN